MGVKLNTNVCRTKIHFPFCEVGLKRQSPLDISWVVDPEKLEILELMTAVVLVTLAEETEKKDQNAFISMAASKTTFDRVYTLHVLRKNQAKK